MHDALESVRALHKECGTAPLSPENRLLDIQSELGELAKEVLKATRYGAVPFRPTDAFREEYGDVLYALLTLAEETDTDPAAALASVLGKYRARFARKGGIGSGNEPQNHGGTP
ncbi:MAG: MazG-like family protein [Clostridia bacterium]|nr:MazG-like family protein [Clostridia bacterium]